MRLTFVSNRIVKMKAADFSIRARFVHPTYILVFENGSKLVCVVKESQFMAPFYGNVELPILTTLYVCMFALYNNAEALLEKVFNHLGNIMSAQGDFLSFLQFMYHL